MASRRASMTSAMRSAWAALVGRAPAVLLERGLGRADRPIDILDARHCHLGRGLAGHRAFEGLRLAGRRVRPAAPDKQPMSAGADAGRVAMTALLRTGVWASSRGAVATASS